MATTEAFSSSQPFTKSWLERARGLVVILIIAPFAALSLFSDYAASERLAVQVFFNLAGWAVFCAGVGMRLWATLYIGGRKGKTLVTEGPYSICRNPLYVGNLLLTLSIALFMQSLLFVVGLFLAGIVYGTVTISSEERRLRQRLGSSFENYCSTVPRLCPRSINVITPPTVEVDVRCLSVEFRRALRYIWIPLVCQLLAHLRTESWWPHFFSLLP